MHYVKDCFDEYNCNCKAFDELWGQEKYIYRVPEQSFQNKVLGFRCDRPYWFSCETDIMPDINFIFGNDG